MRQQIWSEFVQNKFFRRFFYTTTQDNYNNLLDAWILRGFTAS